HATLCRSVGGTPLTSLTVSGTTAIDTTAITTTGTQTYSGAVTLETDPTFTGTLVDFASTLNGAYPLIVVGDAEFHGAVGGTTPLASVSVSGTSDLNGGSVTTSGNQTYEGAVTLSSNDTLTSTGGLVDFQSTVNGGYGLTVDGNVEFGGAVTLASLTVDSGSIDLAADVTTTGDQSYTVTGTGNALDVPSGVTLTSTAGNITLETITGATNITIEGTVSAVNGTATLISA